MSPVWMYLGKVTVEFSWQVRVEMREGGRGGRGRGGRGGCREAGACGETREGGGRRERRHMADDSQVAR